MHMTFEIHKNIAVHPRQNVIVPKIQCFLTRFGQVRLLLRFFVQLASVLLTWKKLVCHKCQWTLG